MTAGAQPRAVTRRFARILFMLASLAVCILSLLPARYMLEVDVSDTLEADKLEHVSSYFALAILGSFAIRAQRSLLLLFVLLCAMGGILELLQAFSPGRTPDIADEIANCAGAAAGVLIGGALTFLLRR